ncbi:MAG: hypothetical protein GF364_12005 [Candidatus Lokiarchaeota archaeon]|nr:hypothetical protein [Candidatus Lokiarchaeota archaeon]
MPPRSSVYLTDKGAIYIYNARRIFFDTVKGDTNKMAGSVSKVTSNPHSNQHSNPMLEQQISEVAESVQYIIIGDILDKDLEDVPPELTKKIARASRDIVKEVTAYIEKQ